MPRLTLTGLTRFPLLPLLLLTLMLGLLGCEQPPAVVEGPEAEALAALRYPGQTEHGPDLDIVVVRKGNQITLTNRTAHSYRDMQLWINQQYVRMIDEVRIGTNEPIPLTSFVNRHREAFPVGSFLQPEKARPVISAELFDPKANVRYRLTVQPDNETLRL
ncbi:MAG: hypothetical protein Kow00105_20210 [Phycisphaeraceae bacterium]